MKAVRFHEFGGPEVLTLEDVPDPTPGDGDVLVRLVASGVNPSEVSRRGGRMGQAVEFPAMLGIEGGRRRGGGWQGRCVGEAGGSGHRAAASVFLR